MQHSYPQRGPRDEPETHFPPRWSGRGRGVHARVCIRALPHPPVPRSGDTASPGGSDRHCRARPRRECTRKRAKRRFRCVATVSSLISIRAAICLSVSPWATRSTTCACRGQSRCPLIRQAWGRAGERAESAFTGSGVSEDASYHPPTPLSTVMIRFGRSFTAGSLSAPDCPDAVVAQYRTIPHRTGADCHRPVFSLSPAHQRTNSRAVFGAPRGRACSPGARAISNLDRLPMQRAAAGPPAARCFFPGKPLKLTFTGPLLAGLPSWK
jgi:hypothetical protein